jgi:hypothetical protein
MGDSRENSLLSRLTSRFFGLIPRVLALPGLIKLVPSRRRPGLGYWRECIRQIFPRCTTALPYTFAHIACPAPIIVGDRDEFCSCEEAVSRSAHSLKAGSPSCRIPAISSPPPNFAAYMAFLG